VTLRGAILHIAIIAADRWTDRRLDFRELRCQRTHLARRSAPIDRTLAPTRVSSRVLELILDRTSRSTGLEAIRTSWRRTGAGRTYPAAGSGASRADQARTIWAGSTDPRCRYERSEPRSLPRDYRASVGLKACDFAGTAAPSGVCQPATTSVCDTVERAIAKADSAAGRLDSADVITTGRPRSPLPATSDQGPFSTAPSWISQRPTKSEQPGRQRLQAQTDDGQPTADTAN
jgi:hypothetical protein